MKHKIKKDLKTNYKKLQDDNYEVAENYNTTTTKQYSLKELQDIQADLQAQLDRISEIITEINKL